MNKEIENKNKIIEARDKLIKDLAIEKNKLKHELDTVRYSLEEANKGI